MAMNAISAIHNMAKTELHLRENGRLFDKAALEDLKSATLALLAYCRTNGWEGYDPYDALNSKVFSRLPFLDFRIPRIIFTQLMKRSPLNFRSLLLIPKTRNPKGLALSLSALIRISNLGLLDQKNDIEVIIHELVTLRSPNTPYWCWGYSFPWQTRTLLVPRGAPNIVCTTFVANAFLDAYEMNHESQYLIMAVSAAEYILSALYWTDGAVSAGFSYPLPSMRGVVHNANFLGAALLCRVYKHSGEKKFLVPALKVARYSAAKQHDDGSWNYGELSTQRWVDNFHTGYNLCALRSIQEYAGTSEFEFHIRRGFEFYRNHFFREDSAPKYFHDCIYPIDIHSVAQSIITLLIFRDLDKNNLSIALSVYGWTMNHMWDTRGYFYYQIFPLYKNRIPYIRWAQAWMLLALSYLLKEHDQGRQASVNINSAF
jgi:hypothetical protein